jgi:hypothetical protein
MELSSDGGGEAAWMAPAVSDHREQCLLRINQDVQILLIERRFAGGTALGMQRAHER